MGSNQSKQQIVSSDLKCMKGTRVELNVYPFNRKNYITRFDYVTQYDHPSFQLKHLCPDDSKGWDFSISGSTDYHTGYHKLEHNKVQIKELTTYYGMLNNITINYREHKVPGYIYGYYESEIYTICMEFESQTFFIELEGELYRHVDDFKIQQVTKDETDMDGGDWPLDD